MRSPISDNKNYPINVYKLSPKIQKRINDLTVFTSFSALGSPIEYSCKKYGLNVTQLQINTYIQYTLTENGKKILSTAFYTSEILSTYCYIILINEGLLFN